MVETQNQGNLLEAVEESTNKNTKAQKSRLARMVSV